MSWLGDKLKKAGIRLDSHTLGNLIKNVSPALAFTPVGALGAGLAAAGGGLLRGESVGQAAASGLKNAAIGGTAKAATGLVRGALQQGASSASAIGDAGVPGSHIATGADFGIKLPASAGAPGSQGLPGSGFLSKAGGFIEKHPTAAAMGLQSVGNLATAGAQNRAANAQATLLEQQAGENEYDRQRRRQRDLELAPLYGQLGSALGTSLGRPVAANPYTAG